MLNKDMVRIASKELSQFFSSPVAYLFLVSFLAATLFIFFWVEVFFARNIADVRPMFEWMPVLLIFLSAALTMRMWSEEQSTGTIEFIATLPTSTATFVVGKFLACWLLLNIALLLTVALPVTVGFISTLDWGPVIAGYLATSLLGAAYLAIGLFVSARTDSQIVSLIYTSLACGIFYLVGSPLLTELVGQNTSAVMHLLGTGTRFESITRGVLDLRDLYYYLSLTGAFLVLNVYAIESQAWAKERNSVQHKKWRVAVALLVINILLVHVWLAPVNKLRLDVTATKMYSISDASRSYLAQLREPLLIRGYFSAKTHPLLAPLVPQMKDLLREFAIAGGSKVRLEIIDPAENPELEDEANNKYNIKPVPFQIPGRHETSLVNSYFDVVLQYGDEHQSLSFRDLIEVKSIGASEIDVQLRNPEFHLARSLKQVLFSFQAGGDLFTNIDQQLKLSAYISSDAILPESLADFRNEVLKVVSDMAQRAGKKFEFSLLDPLADDGQVAKTIAEKYGFRPMPKSLLDTTGFYFYLVLEGDGTAVQIPIADDLSADNFKRDLETGIKRFAQGYLKTLALFTPPQLPPQFQQPGAPQRNSYQQLEETLRSDFNVIDSDLRDGKVPAGAELLMIVDPSDLSELQLFAIDQFLMQGGTLVMSVGAYETQFTEQSLSVASRTTGLESWLESQGVKIDSKLVMDPQNAAFPVPVTREAGGFTFRDYQLLDYPYFVDVRADGLNQDSPITAAIPQITMPWASPVRVDDVKLKVTELIHSSADSWQSSSTNVMPKVDVSGNSGFSPEGDTGRALLGVLLEGRFSSVFKGKPSPLLVDPVADADDPADENGAEAKPEADQAPEIFTSVIEQSPKSARLFLFSSNEFLSDQMLNTLGSSSGTLYLNSIEMMVNTVEWSLEDQRLLTIRSRGNFNRTLPPNMDNDWQSGLEYFNYLIAFFGVGVVFLIHRMRGKRRRHAQVAWLAGDAV